MTVTGARPSPHNGFTTANDKEGYCTRFEPASYSAGLWIRLHSACSSKSERGSLWESGECGFS